MDKNEEQLEAQEINTKPRIVLSPHNIFLYQKQGESIFLSKKSVGLILKLLDDLAKNNPNWPCGQLKD